MKSPLLPVGMLYCLNSGFRWLLGLVCFSAILSRVFYHTGAVLYAQDFFTLLFVAVLWLLFHAGILVKHQFASFRATVIPGYRRAHLTIFLIVYVVLIVCGFFWQSGMRLRLPWMLPESMIGSLAICLLVSLFVITMGYLSSGRALLYGYGLLLGLAVCSMNIIDLFDARRWTNYLPLGLWILGLLIFLRRLTVLHEEHPEYRNLLTWPPQEIGVYIFRGRKEKSLGTVRYAKRFTMVGRLHHWARLEGDNPSVGMSFIAVALSLYLLVGLGVGWARDCLQIISGYFLVYVMTPLCVLGIFYYKRLAAWGIDIVRPISRRQYFSDQAALIFVQGLWYWGLTVVVLGILPGELWGIGPALSIPQALIFVLSGSFFFLIVAVLILLSALDSVVRIIVNGAALTCLSLIFFDIVPDLSIRGLYICIWACLASGFIVVQQGYHAWCNKEYV